MDPSPPLSLVLCPFVSAAVAEFHDAVACPFEHETERQKTAFRSWLQWARPGKPCPVVDLECLDWGQLLVCDPDASKPETRFLTLMNKSPISSLLLEEAMGFDNGFRFCSEMRCSFPVDGYVRLEPAIVVPPLKHVSLRFDFVPFKEGFHESFISLLFNGRAAVVRLDLQAMVLSASDFATFNSASRLVVGEAFYPPAFKDSIWNTPLAFIQAQSLSPAHCGRIVTPVELCLQLHSIIGAFDKFGTVDEKALSPLVKGTLVKAKTRYPFMIVKQREKFVKDKGRYSCHLNENVIGGTFKNESHAQLLSRILVLEELALDAQALSFDVFYKDFTPLESRSHETGEALYTMQVTGASEARPQLLKGDYVRIRSASEPLAYDVSKTGLVTLAAPALPRDTQMPRRVHARFLWSRVRYRRMHEAVWSHRALNLSLAVDPPLHCPEVWDLSHDSFRSSHLSSDQKRAICLVMNAWHYSKIDVVHPHFHMQPILLLGAAGSGKTETIMEVVRRIFATPVISAHGAPRVLLCAPSNGAADVLALRVDALNLTNVNMLRLNSHQRPETELLGGGKLRKYCFRDPVTGLHAMPPILSAFHLVVSTCATAGWISDHHPSFMFDLVIIDECAQASEPEALIAASLSEGPLLLCGDPKQFGPVLRSHRSIQLGAGSLLDRLANIRHLEKRKVVLYNNFRAHPQLMALSSALFYEGKAKASLPPALCEKALAFEDLNGSSTPICFYGVIGKDERDSESFWNVAECFKVAELVQKVLGSQGLGGRITVSDIGVVAPFYRQVRLIREVLRERGLGAIRVGSVADYQGGKGQEEEVLIVSVVRSNGKYVGRDVANNVGLIHSDRSFNVCITRAKCLLLIVGNPRVVSVDPNWRRLLQLTQENNTYHGIDYDINEDRNFTQTELSRPVSEQDYAVLGNYAFDLPWDLGM